MPKQQLITHTPPRGILQDAGELAVLSDHAGPTRHRFAMVVAFSSEEELRQALNSQRCAYRQGQNVQEWENEEGRIDG